MFDVAQMPDGAIAKGLIQEIVGNCWNSQKDMINRAYKALTNKRGVLTKEERNKWTHRRVRSFVGLEAAKIEFREIAEMARVAEFEEQRRQSELKEARKLHAEYIAKTASIAALLERQDEDFHGDQIAGIRGELGGMGRTRTKR